MTADIFREWYLDDFLKEIQDLRDGPIRIQFLLDNCSAHPTDLDDLDPDVFVKFLPPNTTSVIQPMDQAVLFCVKSGAKRAFYLKLFNYCEEHQDDVNAFKDFLREYSIFDAIKDIAAA